ncbi:MAG: hypothetical protein ACMXYD_04780 [Candidatus Woesearchaeota archaeon]
MVFSFDAVGLIDMQEKHKQSLLRENPASSKKELETILENQKEPLYYCAIYKKPVAILTYESRGDILQKLKEPINNLPIRAHIEKKMLRKNAPLNRKWEEELTTFYQTHQATRILLAGMFLESCVYDAANHLTITGHKIFLAENLVDNPHQFPKSTKPSFYDIKTTYIRDFRELL